MTGVVVFRTHGDILRNLGAVDSINRQSMRWVYERLLKLSYGASIIGTVPLVILPSLSLLAPMCDPCFGLSRTATKRLIAVVFVCKTPLTLSLTCHIISC